MAFNLVWNAMKIALMLLLLLLEEQSYSYAKIVSFPRELHVLEGDRGTVRCQNRSMDEQTFYSYVSNAIWWRRNIDGTTTRITTFGSAYSSGHTLNFNPISNENQGSYYCCLPDESTCSNISIVVQSTPPSIRALNSNYTAVVGSQVTMECNIIALGMPTATFGWNKNGYKISHDTIINNFSLGLTLRNVTMEDDGLYNCIARNVLSYRSDHITLTVMQPIAIIEEHSDAFNETSSELNIRVLAENIKTTCQNFQVGIPVELERYIYEQYNHNVSVNTTEILCDDDESVAICDLQFVGLSAKRALLLFKDDLSNSSEGIDFSICRLRLYNQNSLRSNLTTEDEDGTIDNNNDNDDDDDDDAIHLLVTVLLVMIIVFVIISILLCLAICYLRCRKKRNIACLSMQKCVVNNGSSALRNFSSSRGDNVIVDQLSYPASSSSQYNKLQYNYDTDRHLPSNNNLPLTCHEDLSSVHFIPLSNCQNQNTHSLTSNFVMRSDHTTTPSSYSANSNAVLQANGYVLPDDFGKQSHNMSANRSDLTTETQLKSANKRNKAIHKTAVILKSDGTGIVRSGTLQALIPSSRSDENYTVTPSQTHESYFDVVKNT